MGGIKVFVSGKTEQKFRKASMAVFGYRKGALSSAAEQAFEQWSNNVKSAETIFDIPKDPITAIEGMLSHVKKSGVELQHEASKIRAENALKYLKNRQRI